jgi:hypothetical protein
LGTFVNKVACLVKICKKIVNYSHPAMLQNTWTYAPTSCVLVPMVQHASLPPLYFLTLMDHHSILYFHEIKVECCLFPNHRKCYHICFEQPRCAISVGATEKLSSFEFFSLVSYMQFVASKNMENIHTWQIWSNIKLLILLCS